MIALWLFRELMDDGFDARRAGVIACEVAEAARLNPDARAISYVEDYFGARGFAFSADTVPASGEWDAVVFSGSNIRKVTTYRIGELRDMIAHYTEEERSIIGSDDEEVDPVREARDRYINGLITRDEFLALVERTAE